MGRLLREVSKLGFLQMGILAVVCSRWESYTRTACRVPVTCPPLPPKRWVTGAGGSCWLQILRKLTQRGSLGLGSRGDDKCLGPREAFDGQVTKIPARRAMAGICCLGLGIAGLSKKDQGKIHNTRSESCNFSKTSQGSLFQSWPGMNHPHRHLGGSEDYSRQHAGKALRPCSFPPSCFLSLNVTSKSWVCLVWAGVAGPRLARTPRSAQTEQRTAGLGS